MRTLKFLGGVEMMMTKGGSLRPDPVDGLGSDVDELIAKVCPGVVAEARVEPAWADREADPIWGVHGTMTMGWAADPFVRHRAATGGVLTALGMYLLDSNTVTRVLHVGADPASPMRSEAVVSTTADEVLERSGSRYGPTAPLANLHATLDAGEPFAVIAKPCDLGALHRLAAHDPRVDELCVARLTMVCGGSSRLTKSSALLDSHGVTETELSSFRYRGNGNPGLTVAETADGQRFETTYLELWEDEGTWDIETRYKVCPDALGEAADISAADAWPGGTPTGEDEGFNAVVSRSVRGEALWAAAIEAGYIVQGEPVTPRQFDDFQPHQVRKKEALASRYAGMKEAGVIPIHTIGLRVDALGKRLSKKRSRYPNSRHNGTLQKHPKLRPKVRIGVRPQFKLLAADLAVIQLSHH